MRIEYKIVELDPPEGPTCEWSNEEELRSAREKACCSEMRELLRKQIVEFDQNDPILYLNPSKECDHEDHTTIDIRFCPFCGEEMEYALMGRVRRKKRSRIVVIPAKEEIEYYYEDELLPL
jgi:hypothetical protein